MKTNNNHLYFAAICLIAALVSMYFYFDKMATFFAFTGVLMSAFGKKLFKKKDNS